MHTKISPGIVESTLRLDWANYLEKEIRSIQTSSPIRYDEAKVILRKRLGLTKDQINSHLKCRHTIEVENFLYACAILGISYIIDNNGRSQFVPTDSALSLAESRHTSISIVANRSLK